MICKSPSFFQKGIMFKSHLQQNFFFLLFFSSIFRKFDEVFHLTKKNQKAICLVFCQRKKVLLFTENSFLTFNELWRQQQRVIINQSQRAEIMTQKIRKTEKTIIIFSLPKTFFFADDYAIDKNFKNKKLQLKQKGVRWDECFMCFHCYTLVIANNSGNKKNAGVLNHNFANVL